MEMGEGIAMDVAPETTEDECVTCAWKDCEKTHTADVSYPGGGVLTRSNNFAAAWVGDGLEPWELYGAGTDSKATLEDYSKETPKAAYRLSAAAMQHPEYHTQKHHLISINLFKDLSKLKHNATLIGYDVNGSHNGVCLPTYVVDIVQHDLQAHRGNHPNATYNSKILPKLKDIQKDSETYCHGDLGGTGKAQANLLFGELAAFSALIQRRIKAWKWLLRSNALKERTDALARLAKINQVA